MKTKEIEFKEIVVVLNSMIKKISSSDKEVAKHITDNLKIDYENEEILFTGNIALIKSEVGPYICLFE